MEINQEIADRVMRWVVSPDYRPSKPKQIAAQLKLDQDGYREVRRVVKQLVGEGRLVYGSNHLVFSVGSIGGPSDSIRGTFRRAVGGGFGFVRPNHAEHGGELPSDYFVPPGKTLGALEGDLVEITIRPGRRGDQEAVVSQIVQRARRQFTGTFDYVGKMPVVTLDGVPYKDPLSVGDVRGMPLETGDKVFVELVQFPDQEGQGGQAVILQRLGSSKNPAIDTLTVMRQYGLPEEFPEEVLDDARRQADQFDEGRVPEDRKDLTQLLTITIDPRDARDFDDAISLQRESGRWRLWVHIADVSSFVPTGGPIDQEALRRATSVYLPDRVVPMIPEIISNHLASLQPQKMRFVKTVEIEMLDDLTITHTQVHNAVIHSDKRFTYQQVDRFLAEPVEAGENGEAGQRKTHVEKWGHPLCDLLTQMHRLAMQMRKGRFKGGSLSMDMPDIKLDLDRNGKVKGAHRVQHTESHQMIEEFMLAANQAVATWLDDQGLNFLHRIHPPPDRRKLRQLSNFVKDIGIKVDQVESRFEIQSVLDSVAGTPLEDAVNFAVLKSMNKAVYGPQPDGHYALDMQHYCHFTSPIRRYPDLTVHRLVQRLIDGKQTPDESFGMLLKLGHHCSDMERNAQMAERELIDLKLLHFLSKHVGDAMEAVVSRAFADGLHARCLKLPVDGFIPVESLPKDKYRFERRGNMLVGFKDGNRFRLGDQLTVKVARVDLQGRQLYLDVIKNHSVGGNTGSVRGKGPTAKTKYKTKRKRDRREKKKRRNR